MIFAISNYRKNIFATLWQLLILYATGVFGLVLTYKENPQKKIFGGAFFSPGTALWQLFSKLPQRCGNNHDLQVLVCAIAMPTLLTQTNGMSSIVDMRET